MRRLRRVGCMAVLALCGGVLPVSAGPSEAAANLVGDCLLQARLSLHAAEAPVGDCLRGVEAPLAYRAATPLRPAAPVAASPAAASATRCGPLPLYGSRGCPDGLTVVDEADNGNVVDDEYFRLGWEGMFDLAVASDGATAVLAGAVTVDRHESEIELLTVAVDVASGEERWRAVFATAEAGIDFPSTVVVSDDGATAYVSATLGLYRTEPPSMAVVAYDVASGEQRWASVYDVGRPDTASYDFEAALSPDGATIYVVGVTADTQGNLESLLWAVDTASGAQRWALEQNGPFGGFDTTSQVVVSPVDGTVVVGGTTRDAARVRPDDFWVRAITPDGEVRWERRFDAGSHDQITGLAVSPDGRTVAAVGLSDNPPDYTNFVHLGHNRDWATVTWDLDSGQFGWHRRTTGHSGGDNRPFDVAFSPDTRRVFVAGALTDETVATYVYGVRSYPVDTGATLSTYTYAGEAAGAQHPFNIATRLAVSPDGGRVYVTGYSSTLTPANPLIAYAGGGPVYAQNHPLDVATVAFAVNPNGGLSQAWVARWNPSPGFSDEMIPAAIAVASTGEVLVGGTLLYHVSQEFFDADRAGHQNFFDLGLLRYEPW